MRQAFVDVDFLVVDGQKKGIFTGADYCAEHEWGISGLQTALGLDSSLDGVDRRRIKNPQAVALKVYRPRTKVCAPSALLGFGAFVLPNPWEKDGKSYWESDPQYDPKTFWGKRLANDQRLYAAWDEKDCLVGVTGEDNVTLVEQIFKAIQEGRGYFARGGGGAFSNGGILIMDINDIPEEKVRAVLEADLDAKRLVVASEATGIGAKLRATHKQADDWPESGCRWLALSPRWASSKDQERTKYPVVYWLNPKTQDKINYGWFTVEELEQWIEGKGPVVKEAFRKP